MQTKFNKLLLATTSIGLLITLLVVVNPWDYSWNHKAQKSTKYNLKINNLIINKAKRLAESRVPSVYDNLHINKINNKKNGIYTLDCSGFVKLVLQEQSLLNPIREIIDFIPKNFVPSIINETPSPLHYFTFLKNKKAKKHWYIIHNAFDLMPGDFIIYIPKKYKTNFRTYKKFNSEYGQHIMIVADQSQPINFNTAAHNIKLLWIYVLDSTKIPHGKTDLRQIKKSTGIGKGMIGLVINHQNKPIQLIWRDYSKDKFWIPTKKDLLERDIILARIVSD